MIPIVVFWTNYTATVNGRVVKLVPCEHCKTEYVYVLEREGAGAGTSVYGLNGEAATHAAAAAEDTLQQYLENDFDPVPCPICGHYQRYMFPKLYEPHAWVQIARLVAIAAGCLTAVVVAYWGFAYLDRPGDHALGRLAAMLGLLTFLGLIVLGLDRAERSRARRFDPNTEDQQARVERGRLRATTRAEFEASQQREREARGRFIEPLRQKAQQDQAKGEQENPG